MTASDIAFVASDNAVTRRERRRQSDHRDQVLRLPPGTDRRGRVLGNHPSNSDRRNNFVSAEAADYAAERVDVVRREGASWSGRGCSPT